MIRAARCGSARPPSNGVRIGGIRAYCLLAGACDLSTGLALLAAPAELSALLGVDLGAADTVFLRWIGVFVGGVGSLYLYPLALTEVAWRRRLRPVLEATALLRAAVAAFLVTTVTTRLLPFGWLTVAAVDGSLAVLQAVWLVRRAPADV